jgi:hypothetical protein
VLCACESNMHRSPIDMALFLGRTKKGTLDKDKSDELLTIFNDYYAGGIISSEDRISLLKALYYTSKSKEFKDSVREFIDLSAEIKIPELHLDDYTSASSATPKTPRTPKTPKSSRTPRTPRSSRTEDYNLRKIVDHDLHITRYEPINYDISSIELIDNLSTDLSNNIKAVLLSIANAN